MSYEMFYIVGICVATVFLGGLLGYVLKKCNIDSSEVAKNVDVANEIVEFAKSTLITMKFGDEKEIEAVSQAISQSLDYVKTITEDISKEDKIKKATAYSIQLCSGLDIKLDKSRILIINSVIKLSYNLVK